MVSHHLDHPISEMRLLNVERLAKKAAVKRGSYGPHICGAISGPKAIPVQYFDTAYHIATNQVMGFAQPSLRLPRPGGKREL
jgi:hypothetical protein